MSGVLVGDFTFLGVGQNWPGWRARDLRPHDEIRACILGGKGDRHLTALEIGRHGHHVHVGDFPVTHTAATPAARFNTPDTASTGPLRHVALVLDGPLTKALAKEHLSAVETDAIIAWLQADADLPAELPPKTQIGLLLGTPPGASTEQLLRLRIRLQGDQTRELFSYVDVDGRRWLLDRHGLGILHLPLETPVDYTRISSGWGWRDQPVLHVPEFHKGIDFAAPMGTPVRAAAGGVIAFRGWHGNYGRLVIVRHTALAETRYGHLSRYAHGLHPGSHVHRGQIIGYVGSTGLSTGPHLYYELYLDHLRVDPLTTEVNLPVRLEGPLLRRFKHYVAHVDDLQVADAG